MSLSAIKPPLWVWSARIVGLAALLLGLLLPGGYLGWRSVAGMPIKQVVSVKDLRPTMMVLPAGKFQMGSPEDDQTVIREYPRHEVELTQRLGISETEVTQAQYLAVMKKNPSHFRDRDGWENRPVEQVSWFDAIEYCNQLSVMEGKEPCYLVQGKRVEWPKGLACPGYRLPTEAEWEYAARADEGTEYAGSHKAEEVAWFGENEVRGSTHEVKGKKPNQWGLYDLSGNVEEWVWDLYNEYQSGPETNPVGPLLDGPFRMLRGGSWNTLARSVRAAHRSMFSPEGHYQGVGFRLARSYP